MTTEKKLEALMKNVNIANTLSPERLSEIGAKVTKDYDIDFESRSDIDKINKEAMKLAKQTYEEKSTPWPKAANIKYPLITVATIQFASRAFPELVPDEKIVNFKITGDDEDKIKEERSERVSMYMDYQLTEEIQGWMDGTDRMLHNLPITGTCFRKIYFDSLKGVVASKFLTYDDVVVNAKAEDLESARRISHRLYRYDNHKFEMIAKGLWKDTELGTESDEDGDDDAPRLYIEQHRWLDLDGDGYEEPYIVTVHKSTSTVMRIVARYDADGVIYDDGKLVRIEPIQHFIKYPFIPNPDGGFYDIGFGTLLYPINISINTVINQLLDGGTLANTGGGFLARGVKLHGGEIKFAPGEWKKTDVMGQDLKSGIFPLPIQQPSQVLFQLLGLLISAGKDISSVQEAMAGQKPGENVSEGTVNALIEQGLKVFSGIYKRIYRSLRDEFKLIYRLNYKFAEDKKYFKVVDRKVSKEDFSNDGYDIQPAAEPIFSLETQRVGQAESLLKISGRQGLDEEGITAQYIKAIKAPAALMLPPEKRQKPPMDPKMEQIKLEYDKFDHEKKSSPLKDMKIFAEVEVLITQGIANIAKAEAAEEGIQLDQYKAFLEDIGNKMEGMKDEYEQRGVRGVEGKPNNQKGAQATPRPEGGMGRRAN